MTNSNSLNFRINTSREIITIADEHCGMSVNENSEDQAWIFYHESGDNPALYPPSLNPAWDMLGEFDSTHYAQLV